MLKQLAAWGGAFLLLLSPASAVLAQVNLACMKIVQPTQFAGSRVERLYKLGASVLGPGWKPLAKTRDSAIFIYNEALLSADGLMAVRIGIEFAKAQGTAYFRSSRDMYQVDCRRRMLAVSEILRFKDHFGDGELVDSYTNNAFVLAKPDPDTVGRMLIGRVCDRGVKI